MLDPPRRQHENYDSQLEARVASKRGEAQPEESLPVEPPEDPWAELGSPKMNYSRLHARETAAKIPSNAPPSLLQAEDADDDEYSWRLKAFKEEQRLGERRRSIDEEAPVRGAKARQRRLKKEAVQLKLVNHNL